MTNPNAYRVRQPEFKNMCHFCKGHLTEKDACIWENNWCHAKCAGKAAADASIDRVLSKRLGSALEGE